MSEFYEDTSDFTLPAGCEDCPVQCDIGAKLLEMMLAKQEEEVFASTLVGDQGQEIDDMLRDAYDGDEDLAKAHGGYIRRTTGERLDFVDEATQSLIDQSQTLANSCDRPLKMRAAKKSKVYEVQLCTSALEYYIGSEKPSHTPTHIWVKTPQIDD